MRFVFVLLLSAGALCQPLYVRKTVCASGCDYALTVNGIYQAMQDAAAYQDTVACVPYIIEGTGTIVSPNTTVTSYFFFPPKVCKQFVTVRSANRSHFAAGVRYNPASDDTSAFVIQGSEIFQVQNTNYWRLQNVLLETFSAAGNLDTCAITSAVVVANSNCPFESPKFCIQATVSPGCSITAGRIGVNGVSPNNYNVGNAVVQSVSANVITYGTQNANPGAYIGGGTISWLMNGVMAFMVGWGGGPNVQPDTLPHHLEIVQSSLRAGGVGDAYNGINISGNDVSVIDSHLSGFTEPGQDSTGISLNASNFNVRNNYLESESEDFISGGSFEQAGVVPERQQWYGNLVTKAPWMNWSYGNGAPAKPCFNGSMYHDTANNVDYVCNSGGSWVLQTTLLPYSIGYFPFALPKNLWECKTCKSVRFAGNWMSGCSADSNQSCTATMFEEATQPFLPSTQNCNATYPYNSWPCRNVPQPWTTVSDIAVQGNRYDETLLPFSLVYSYYPVCPYIKARWGSTNWKVTGDGTNTVMGTGLPIGYCSFPGCGTNWSSMLVDGATVGVNSVSADGTSMVMELPIPPGTHNAVIPCFDGHHLVNYRQNLITNNADERSYCTAIDGSYCGIAAGCGQNCGSGGYWAFDSSQHDVLVENNTQTTSIFSSASGLTGQAGGSFGTTDFAGYWRLKNNILPAGVNGFNPNNGCGLQAMSAPNNGVLDLHKNILTTETPTSQTWQPFTTGNLTPGCSVPIWPTDHAGAFSWTTLLDGSTYKVSNPTYQGWGTDGRDPGADVDYVNMMTAHAMDGQPNPALDYHINSLIPSPGFGLTIDATAYDTSPCTWELSTNNGSYASPVPISAQMRIGRHITATWNDGTLLPSTSYFARMICAGHKMEWLANLERAYVITPPAQTQNVLPIKSYSMPNGVGHSANFCDALYPGGVCSIFGAGFLAPLAGSTGYLTSGALGFFDLFVDTTQPVSNVLSSSFDSGTNTITLTIDHDLTSVVSAGSACVNPPTQHCFIVVRDVSPTSYDNSYIAVSSVTSSTISYAQNPSTSTPSMGGHVYVALMYSAQSPQWVGWSNSGTPNLPAGPDIVIQYDVPHVTTALRVYVNNSAANPLDVGSGVYTPGDFVISYSDDGVTWANPQTYVSSPTDLAIDGAGWVTIPLTNTAPSLWIKVHIDYQPSRSWIVIGQIQALGH